MSVRSQNVIIIIVNIPVNSFLFVNDRTKLGVEVTAYGGGGATGDAREDGDVSKGFWGESTRVRAK